MDKLKESFYKELLENISDGVYFVDKDRKILFWNKSAERITGFSRDEILGRYCFDNLLRHIDESGKELCKEDCPLVYSIRDNKIEEADVYLHRKDGVRVPIHVSASPIFDEKGDIIGAVEIFRKSVESIIMKKRLRELEKEAFLDPLTGVPNRRFINIQMEKLFYEFKTYGNRFGLYFIDIDKFKFFNDTYGHDVGDEVLKVVSGSSLSALRGSDLIGRWGGDEFIAIVLDIDENSLKEIGERIRILVKNSNLSVSDKNLHVTVSIGGTIIKEDDSLDSLIMRADMLMLESKRKGGDKVTVG